MIDRFKGIFSGITPDPEIVARMMNNPPAAKNFVVYFTPRSGSSWLTDVLAQTKRMGRCNEAFNPNFLPQMARACQADNLEDYIDHIQRRLKTRNMFSFEITFHQLKAIFPDESQFLRHFGVSPCFWLIREDIVEQAVSLAKMVTTQVAHSPHSTPEDRAAADARFDYDAKLIRKWLNHILAAERENEAYFARNRITPMRISYERMFAIPTDHMLAIMADHVDMRLPFEEAYHPAHEKLGTSRNASFADRFRQEQADFLAEVDTERAPWLAQLQDLALTPTGPAQRRILRQQREERQQAQREART